MADREPFVGTMTNTDDFTNLKPIYSAGPPHQCCSVRLCMFYPKLGFVFLNNNNINNGRVPCTTKKRRHLFLYLKPLLSVWRNTYCNEQPSQATETPSVEKHAHPPRVVYCAIYLTLTRITKFRVSNLHITTR